MNRTQKVMKVIRWLDEGEKNKAVDYFWNDLDDKERDFIVGFLKELRDLAK